MFFFFGFLFVPPLPINVYLQSDPLLRGPVWNPINLFPVWSPGTCFKYRKTIYSCTCNAALMTTLAPGCKEKLHEEYCQWYPGLKCRIRKRHMCQKQEMFQHNYILHYRQYFNASCIGSQPYSNREAESAENNDKLKIEKWCSHVT